MKVGVYSKSDKYRPKGLKKVPLDSFASTYGSEHVVDSDVPMEYRIPKLTSLEDGKKIAVVESGNSGSPMTDEKNRIKGVLWSCLWRRPTPEAKYAVYQGAVYTGAERLRWLMRQYMDACVKLGDEVPVVEKHAGVFDKDEEEIVLA